MTQDRSARDRASCHHLADVLLGPRGDRFDRLPQRPAERRQGVFHPWRYLGENLSGEHAVSFHHPQGLGEHPVVALPAVAIGLWAVWLAPTGAHRLPDPARFIAQAALFAATGALLAVTHKPWWGVAFAVVAIVVFALSCRFA